MSGAQFIEFWRYILRLAIMLVVGVCEKSNRRLLNLVIYGLSEVIFVGVG